MRPQESEAASEMRQPEPTPAKRRRTCSEPSRERPLLQNGYLWKCLCRGFRYDEYGESGQAGKKAPASWRRPWPLKKLKVNVENLDTILDKTADRQNQHAQDFAKDAVQETGEVIRRSPLAAVATALGLGFLFGLFKRRG